MENLNLPRKYVSRSMFCVHWRKTRDEYHIIYESCVIFAFDVHEIVTIHSNMPNLTPYKRLM